MRSGIPPRGRLVIAAVLGLIAVVLGGWRATHRSSAGPLEVAFWYWHRPFALSAPDRDALRSMGARRLFVRTGTLMRDPEGLRLAMPQEWKDAAAGFEVHLVINVDYGVLREFDAMPAAALASTLRDDFAREVRRARILGVRVKGIQLDCDCPTRLLPKYAEVLRACRPAIHGEPLTLSITALPTWLGAPELRDVARAVDFLVPQFYEPGASGSGGFATIWSRGLLEQGMRRLAAMGVPFYAGLPAYGHALVYGAGGRPRGAYRDASPLQAYRNPSFRFEGSYASAAGGRPAGPGAPAIHEDVVVFSAGRTGAAGAADRWRIVYELPTPALVADGLAAVKAARPANCRGVIIYRLGEPGEALTVPPAAIAEVVAGRPAIVRAEVTAGIDRLPWRMVESGGASGEMVELRLRMRSTGTAASFPAPDAVTTTVRLPGPGLESVAPGGFDAVETLAADGSRCGPRRARMLRFRCFHMPAGARIEGGPVVLSARTAAGAVVEWSIRGPGGSVMAAGRSAVQVPNGGERERSAQ